MLELKKNRKRIPVVIMLIILGLISCSKKPIGTINHEKVIKDPVGLIEGEVVINTFFDEVIRSKEINRIDLVAKKDQAPFYYGLVLIVDGNRYPLKNVLKGYKPELDLADFTFDGIKDLLIKIKSGETDSSMFFSIYFFKQREFQTLYSVDDQNGIVPFEFVWNTDFEMQIKSSSYNLMIRKHFEFPNISFIQCKIGFTKYQDLQAIDVDSDGQYELMGIQSVWLKFPHHVVFRIKTILKFTEEKWKLIEYQLIPVKLVDFDTSS